MTMLVGRTIDDNELHPINAWPLSLVIVDGKTTERIEQSSNAPAAISVMLELIAMYPEQQADEGEVLLMQL